MSAPIAVTGATGSTNLSFTSTISNPLLVVVPGRVGGVVTGPHPSQCRTCEFPASGSSRERFARGGEAVQDLGWRQRVPGQKFVEAGPWDRAATMTPRQPLAPDAHHLPGEPMQAPTVSPNAIVGEVAPHHRGQVPMLVAKRPVAVVPTPVVHRGHRAGKPALGRHLPNHVLAVPGPPPNMGEA